MWSPHFSAKPLLVLVLSSPALGQFPTWCLLFLSSAGLLIPASLSELWAPLRTLSHPPCLLNSHFPSRPSVNGFSLVNLSLLPECCFLRTLCSIYVAQLLLVSSWSSSRFKDKDFFSSPSSFSSYFSYELSAASLLRNYFERIDGGWTWWVQNHNWKISVTGFILT